jgi:predicted signal transduction protein with EAL and GGDEF domain
LSEIPAGPGGTAPHREIEERVRSEVIDLLYGQVPLSAVISALVASILCALLWNVTRHDLLGAWWLVIVTLSAARLLLTFAYRRRSRETNVRAWERRFIVTLIMTGVAWGIGAWAVMPKDSLAYQAVVYFFLMGMVGGAVANYSGHPRTATATVILVMLPATLWLALEDNVLTRAMAIGAVIYVVAAFRAATTLSASFRHSIRLTHELAHARANAERLARTDDLTGMRNRRAFYEVGELAMAQAKRYDDPIAVISLDIDAAPCRAHHPAHDPYLGHRRTRGRRGVRDRAAPRHARAGPGDGRAAARRDGESAALPRSRRDSFHLELRCRRARCAERQARPLAR